LGQRPTLPRAHGYCPKPAPSIAAAVAIPLWLVAAVAFAMAALSFWGAAMPIAGWRQLAVGGAVASILGMAVFFGTWPGSPDTFYSLLNTAVALAMNLGILGSQLWLHWPPQVMFGR
jgi:hypothetical protein